MDGTSDRTATISPLKEKEFKKPGIARDLGLFPVPKHLRYDPDAPPSFGLALNVGFAFASTFSECALSVLR